MSVQFGKCNLDGKPVDPLDLEKTRNMLAPYGPDGEGYVCKGSFGVLYRAFHTTKESRYERQPCVLEGGDVLTWDGRLDNRRDLLDMLSLAPPHDLADAELVAAAYQRWGANVLPRLLGDWALSIWQPRDQSLTLAKDFIGTCNLYYTVERDRVTWSTILDPLVLFAGHQFRLQEGYIAGWLAFFPAADLSPYVGIRAVPPGCLVRLGRGTHRITKYWDFDPGLQIRYPRDPDYEEHFRIALSQAVRRRLRSDTPTLAELSGGMDSSSIVCLADSIMADGACDTPRIDTVSYFDDSEPNWNERPYFETVEKKRGRTGCHIDIASRSLLTAELERQEFAATPAYDGRENPHRRVLRERIRVQGNRVLLSGLGGDEVLGGVPTPMPELEDLLARAQFRGLARQLKLWSLEKRRPWLTFLFEAIRGFLPGVAAGIRRDSPAHWLQSDFVRKNHEVLHGYDRRLRIFGPLPSFQENLATLEFLRRQLACIDTPCSPLLERRYPLLDRKLLEFLYAIPRTQLVRPGQRRSLMRRALVGIVPREILERKRKAFTARAAVAAICADWANLSELSQDLVTAEAGIVEPKAFRNALVRAREGKDVPMVALLRTLNVEFWLRAAVRQTLFETPPVRRNLRRLGQDNENQPPASLEKDQLAS